MDSLNESRSKLNRFHGINHDHHTSQQILTTNSEKRACSSSSGGMGALNSSSCRGTLSFRLISGGSLLLKQHRKPRAGRVRFRGGILSDQEEPTTREAKSLLSRGHDLKEKERGNQNLIRTTQGDKVTIRPQMNWKTLRQTSRNWINVFSVQPQKWNPKTTSKVKASCWELRKPSILPGIVFPALMYLTDVESKAVSQQSNSFNCSTSEWEHQWKRDCYSRGWNSSAVWSGHEGAWTLKSNNPHPSPTLLRSVWAQWMEPPGTSLDVLA